jgi:hypothetical protein
MTSADKGWEILVIKYPGAQKSPEGFSCAKAGKSMKIRCEVCFRMMRNRKLGEVVGGTLTIQCK